jgi:DNA/RNA-binding domain of Phe-tRNA-synthetase-like protein
MSAQVHRIDPTVFARWPGYCRGIVAVRGARNGPSSPALIETLRQTEAGLRSRTAGRAVTDVPEIAAWREAFRAFGAKPAEHRSAIEALSRRVLRPDTLPHINALVDIGNIVSLRHLLPAGVHPLPGTPTPLELRPARDGDRFEPADGGDTEAPPPGEIVFCQGSQVLTRRWTWRQGAGTQTLPSTSAVFFNIDGLPPVTADRVRLAMQDIVTLVEQETGGQIVCCAVLDAAHPTLTLSIES